MRIEQLTFTRFIAAISIVIFHYGWKSFLFNNKYVDFIFEQANIGVSYFFILSGFVMIIAYGRKSVIDKLEYYKNRFSRIYPVYLIGILLVFLGQFLTKQLDYEGLFLNLFMIQSWIPDKALTFNSPGWSISVELLFYILFPFLFNSLYKNISFNKILFGILLFWIISQFVFHFIIFTNFEIGLLKTKDFLYQPILHLNEFLIGNLAGLYYINKLSKKERKYDFQIIIILSLIILALKYPMDLNFHNGLLSILFIPLILLISSNKGVITKIFKSKLCIFLGEISFGIYILQYPVFSLISAYSLNKYFHITDYTLVFFIRLFLLLFLASVVFLYIEVPLKSKIRNLKRIRL